MHFQNAIYGLFFFYYMCIYIYIGMATRSSILAWRIPWTEEPGGYSHKKSVTIGSQRVGYN